MRGGPPWEAGLQQLMMHMPLTVAAPLLSPLLIR